MSHTVSDYPPGSARDVGPNITGSFGSMGGENTANPFGYGYAVGAFYQVQPKTPFARNAGNTSAVCDYYMDVSRVSSTYGGTTVQPKALVATMAIRY